MDKVEQTLRHILQMEPDKEVHVIALAQFLVSQGRGKEGEKSLQEFIVQHPKNFNVRFALADLYFSRKQESRAGKVLAEIIQLDPDGPNSLKAKNKMARLYVTKNQLDEADKLVKEILKNNPGDMDANMVQGLIALAQKDGLKAVNSFRVMAKDQPQKPEGWFLLAQAHLINNEPEQAKENVKKAIELKKDYQEAKNFLYSQYIKNKDYDGLIQTIQGYLKNDDKDVANLAALGDVYAAKGDFTQARQTYQKIIDLDPKKPQGYYSLGMLSRKQKQPEQSIKFFDAALSQDPNFIPALQQLVDIYHEQKRPEKGLEAVKQALTRSPKNPFLQQMVGEVLLIQKQPQAAAEAFEQSLLLNPRQLGALRLLIVAYQSQPDPEKVYSYLQERSQNSANPPFYTLALAMLYEKQKKFDQAVAIYENMIAKKIFPDLARNNLAYGLAEHNPTPENLERAAQLITEALEEAPEDANLIDTLGWIKCKKGELVLAKEYLTQAASKAPNNPAILFHLGWCQAQLGEKEEARQSLEKALSGKAAFPDRDAAQKLLESLGTSEKS
jgi:tetratricopeptide (TPR) repeat protein